MRNQRFFNGELFFGTLAPGGLRDSSALGGADFGSPPSMNRLILLGAFFSGFPTLELSLSLPIFLFGMSQPLGKRLRFTFLLSCTRWFS